MLNIYKHFWQVNWAEQWQYRANLMMYLLYWIVSPVVYLAVWITIANSQGSVNGLTANDFVTYYLTLLIVDQITSDITIHVMAYKIQDGTLSGDLLRPVHPVLTGVLVNNIAFKALNFIALIPIWIVLALLFHPDYSSVTAGSLLLSIPALLLGAAISFFLGATVTSLAFWTTRVYAISEFYSILVILFSGQFVPLQLMPPIVQKLAYFLPFQMFKYVPIMVILNRLPTQEIWLDYAAGAVWLVLSYLLFRWTWRAGVRRFSAVGA
ncbi:MAG TPA: ABC-2 family transporter protein [Candidatus Acidoferrum sp.]|nr:ABC-2 family transporter protein [Candidatus Acidoferrum sp.]